MRGSWNRKPASGYEDANGLLYRVGYTGAKGTTTAPVAVPVGPLQKQLSQGNNVPLVLERTPNVGAVRVRSPAFADGQPLPSRFSAYHEGVSPLQGATSRGAPGYYGPRPPVGDPPHHYHFQVLALDAHERWPARPSMPMAHHALEEQGIGHLQ